jgi:hypothetical protein
LLFWYIVSDTPCFNFCATKTARAARFCELVTLQRHNYTYYMGISKWELTGLIVQVHLEVDSHFDWNWV